MASQHWTAYIEKVMRDVLDSARSDVTIVTSVNEPPYGIRNMFWLMRGNTMLAKMQIFYRDGAFNMKSDGSMRFELDVIAKQARQVTLCAVSGAKCAKCQMNDLHLFSRDDVSSSASSSDACWVVKRSRTDDE